MMGGPATLLLDEMARRAMAMVETLVQGRTVWKAAEELKPWLR